MSENYPNENIDKRLQRIESAVLSIALDLGEVCEKNNIPHKSKGEILEKIHGILTRDN